MLQKIRDHLQGVVAWIILGILALVFAAWGATGMVDVGFGAPTFAAKANGARITAEEANRAWQDRQLQLAQFGATEFTDEQRTALQAEVLEGLVAARLVTDRTRELGYRVTDSQLLLALKQIPAFQVDGEYNAQVAKALLAQRGIAPEDFDTDLRRSLVAQQLQDAIRVSDFVTPRELERIVALEDEQREVRHVVRSIDEFAPARIEESAVEAYYQANAARFRTTESVRLAYGELRLEQAAAAVQVAEQDLRALYDENRERYVEPEKRRARHILIQVKSPQEDAAALARANEVLGKIRAGGDFAALAREVSEDTGSAAQGGDLGWAEKSFFVGPFSDALFAMTEGEVRGPVKTQFGYHLIRLDGVQPGAARSYEEARADLEAEARSNAAADLFGERGELAAARIEAGTADLGALAAELGLATGEVAEFVRGAGGGELGATAELQEVVFGDAVLNQGRVGGPVPLGEDRWVVVKVIEHRKPEPKPLAAVRDEIVAELRREQGLSAARARAEADLARLAVGEPFDAVTRGAKVEGPAFIGRNDPAAPAPLRVAAFEAKRPASGAVTHFLATLPDGVAVAELLRVRADAALLTPEQREERARTVGARAGFADLSAYVEELRRTADVETNVKAFQ
jgi:peptidyl-prolyl cis-trans isomerase D